MADQNRNQRQERRITIEIMNEAPVKSGDNWELTIWAVVKKDNNPFEGAEVRFSRTTEDVGSEITNSDGCTNPLIVPVLANKTSVQIAVTTKDDNDRIISRKKEIIIPRPTVLDKRADEWSTHVVGSEGEYTAYVSITGQNQLPLEGILVHVYFDRGTQLAGSGDTNKNGLAIIPILKFSTSFKDIIIEAVGTRIKPEKKRLYLRHDRTPPPIPEPPEDIDQTSGLMGLIGIFKAFIAGLTSGE